MRKPPLQGILIPLLLIFASFIYLQSNAQSGKSAIDWSTDTVSGSSAATRATKFRSDLNNAGKKATRIFTLPVDKLKEITDACYSHGVTEVKVLVVSIRTEDTAHYARRNPGLTATERRDLIGRQAIVIRVPRRAFVSASGSGIMSKNHPLLLSLLTVGLVPVDNPIGGMPVAEGDYYFELGSICPPPGSCDN